MTRPTAEIATSRFAFGAERKQLLIVEKDPLAWLSAQIRPLKMPHQWHSQAAFLAEANYRTARMEERKSGSASSPKNSMEKPMENQMSESMGKVEAAKPTVSVANKVRRQAFKEARESQIKVIKAAVTSEHGFQYRLLDFFSNHFSISQSNQRMRLFAPTLESEAIAPYLDGTFSDMLRAVCQHPAMIYYLNNEQSVGERSYAAKKRKNKGLNENLAREILELHTLGVNSTYTQKDVKELARAISGWSINFNQKKFPYGFKFNAYAHEPGKRLLMGKSYPADGVKQGEQILFDLANHSDTAVHVSYKMVRHFIADEPDLNLVRQMANTWLKTGGNLKSVVLAMLSHPSAWAPSPQKYKTPRHFIISSLRAAQQPNMAWRTITTLEQMGQAPFNAGAPAGYGDLAEHWNGGKALISRVEWSSFIAAKNKKEPLSLAQNSLGRHLSKDTEQAIKRSESRQQALTIMLMSPEFQIV